MLEMKLVDLIPLQVCQHFQYFQQLFAHHPHRLQMDYW
jgi:hypothetical protein